MLTWRKPGVLFDLSHHDCLQYYAVFITSTMIIYFTHVSKIYPKKCLYMYLKIPQGNPTYILLNNHIIAEK